MLCTVVEMASELLRTLATATSGVVGTAFLRALVRQLAEAYDARTAYLAEADEDGFTVVAGWGSGPPEGARTSPAEAAGFVVPLGGSRGEWSRRVLWKVLPAHRQVGAD